MTLIVVLLALAVVGLGGALVLVVRRPPIDQAVLLEQLVTTNQAQLKTQHDLAAVELEKREQAVKHAAEPISESLQEMNARLEHLEVSRQQAYVGLTEQVRALQESHEVSRDVMTSLVTALRSPSARGRWGEIQLRRVVEMAGMLQHCDFEDQPTVVGEDGRLRPDMRVKLPGRKTVVVDSKVPLQAYLEAIEAGDDAGCKAKLIHHARQVRTHVDKLAAKSYWEQFDHAPDFVVLFVPGDPLLTAALEHDPGLMEHAVANKVLLATPVTLIALLRAVAYGWQQEALADNARQIADLGREMQDRIITFVGHFSKVGRHFDRAVDAYNDAVGSLEHRVLPQARRFSELGVSDKQIVAPTPVAQRARSTVGLGAEDDERIPELAPVEDGDDGEDGTLALEA